MSSAHVRPRAYRFLIELEHVRPRTWRRIVIGADASFADLHGIIQAVMPWSGDHLHEFEIGERRIGPTGADELGLREPPLDERQVRLWQLRFQEGDRFRYTYDFGDDWRHRIVVERVIDDAAGAPMPSCVSSGGPPPPEDGTPWGERGQGARFDTDRALEPLRRSRPKRSRWPHVGATCLIWTFADLAACLKCRGPLKAATAYLTANRSNGSPAEDVLRFQLCRRCSALHGDMDDLANLMQEHACEEADIQGFEVDGRRVETLIGTENAIPTPPSEDSARLMPWSEQRKNAELQRRPTPSADEVVRLPLLAGPWELACGPHDWVRKVEEKDNPWDTSVELAYSALVATPDDFVRGVLLGPREITAPDRLADLVLRACALPMADLPAGRPAGVTVADRALSDRLRPLLQPAGIDVQVGPTHVASRVLELMWSPPGRKSRNPWWINEVQDDMRFFFEESKQFLHARPWRAVPSETYLRVHIDEGPDYYVALMGQNPEPFSEKGLVLFKSWDELDTFARAARAGQTGNPLLDLLMMDADEDAAQRFVEETGGFEGASLHPLHALHPADADLLYQMKLLPPLAQEIFLPVRYGPDGATCPTIPVRHYGIVLGAIANTLVRPKGSRAPVLRRKRFALSTNISGRDVSVGPATPQN